jgi:hypothetical protein
MRAAGPLAPIGNRREVDFFLRHSRLQMHLLPCSRTTAPLALCSCGSLRSVGLSLLRTPPSTTRRYAHPVISVEEPTEWRTSRIARINYSDHHRDSVLNQLSADEVKAYYRACKLCAANPRRPTRRHLVAPLLTRPGTTHNLSTICPDRPGCRTAGTARSTRRRTCCGRRATRATFCASTTGAYCTAALDSRCVRMPASLHLACVFSLDISLHIGSRGARGRDAQADRHLPALGRGALDGARQGLALVPRPPYLMT